MESRYHPGEPERQLSEEERWEVVVGAILTQNTTWMSTAEAIRALQGHKSLQPARLARLTLPELSKLIRPSRYHNQKACRLRDIASYVLHRYGDSVNALLGCGPPDRSPDKSDEQLRQELLRLDGIGRKLRIRRRMSRPTMNFTRCLCDMPSSIAAGSRSVTGVACAGPVTSAKRP